MSQVKRTIRATFVVSVNLPDGVSASDMRDYIELEIECGPGDEDIKGCLNIDATSLSVTYVGQELI